LLLGFLENLTAGVTKAGLKDIFAFVLLILTLLFRPQGLFGKGKAAVESGDQHS
jgi:branched-chain amino acid transport system permease protein